MYNYGLGSEPAIDVYNYGLGPIQTLAVAALGAALILIFQYLVDAVADAWSDWREHRWSEIDLEGTTSNDHEPGQDKLYELLAEVQAAVGSGSRDIADELSRRGVHVTGGGRE